MRVARTGQLVVAAYLLSFLLPLDSNIALLILAISSVLVTYIGRPETPRLNAVHIYLIAMFLILMAMAIAASEKPAHSFFTSAPFLPAMLVFSLIIQCYKTAKDFFRLYFVLSLLSLGLCILLLANFQGIGVESSTDWIKRIRTTLLVVPNDALLFSLIMPLSLSLVLNAPRSYRAILPAISILLALTTIVLLQSRGAILISGISFLIVIFNFFRFRTATWVVVSAGLAILALDAMTGFTLLSKFTNIQDTRFSLWIAAWKLFLEKPWLGFGPHTYVFFYQEFLPLDSGFAIESRITPWAHNLYLELLSEQGILVASSFALLLVFNLTRAWKAACYNARRSLVELGAATSMTGFVLAAGIELSFIRIWVVLMLFVLLAIIHNLPTRYPESSDIE